MKKIVIITSILLATAQIATSQVEFEDVRFGFQMSPTFSWMNANVTTINNSGTNLGLKLGMTGEYYFRENYAITGGLGFAFNSGGTLLFDNPGIYWNETDLPPALDTISSGNTKLKYNIQYVEIPVGLKLRTNEFGYMRYFLEPAITIGINTQARGELTGPDGALAQEDEKYDIRREVNALNLAWGITAGFEYAVSQSMSLVGGLGFQSGFTDVTTDNNGNQEFDSRRGVRDEDSKATTNSIIIRIGVMF